MGSVAADAAKPLLLVSSISRVRKEHHFVSVPTLRQPGSQTDNKHFLEKKDGETIIILSLLISSKTIRRLDELAKQTSCCGTLLDEERELSLQGKALDK